MIDIPYDIHRGKHSRGLILVNNKTPVAIYNADKQELVAVTESIIKAIKYVYGNEYTRSQKSMFLYRIKKKMRIKTPRYPFKIAVRIATTQQIEKYLKHNI